MDKKESIKKYLQRLNAGESMDAVRADFAKDFKDVPASEIMTAEQELIDEGQPVKKVKELCDIHSALFLHHKEQQMIGQAGENKDNTSALRNVPGHPLQTLYRENDAIAQAVVDVENAIANGENAVDSLDRLRKGISVHYAKKGDLIYPVLNVKYGFPGPSQVMWSIDGDIRTAMANLVKTAGKDGIDENWKEQAAAVVKRVREMTFKENRILFAVCAANFSDKDWLQMYADSKSYGICLDVEPETWADGESYYNKQLDATAPAPEQDNGELMVKMPGGTLSVSQLTALLDALPMEITFVDAENINRYFNQPYKAKAFKRPLSALGREVFTCHPPKVEQMVRAIIQDFRDGKRDNVPVKLKKDGHDMLVTYIAVRNTQGEYLGTMEIVQDLDSGDRC